MTKLKIILLGIVLPVLLAYLNNIYSSSVTFEWGYRHGKSISVFLFALAIVSCFTLFKKSKHWAWRLLSIFLVILLFLFIYIVTSFRFSI